LGPNGAGKTTMMNMLTGRVRADSDNGRIINVLGYDPLKNELEIRYLTGIVPQENNLDVELLEFSKNILTKQQTKVYLLLIIVRAVPAKKQ
jgi:ABC-type multidrug transport system ATPase subunit